MTPDGNGTPTIGEIGRNVVALRDDMKQLRSEVTAYANLGVERRLTAIEEILQTGQNQRSGAAWQLLFIVLGVVGSIVGAVVIALVVNK